MGALVFPLFAALDFDAFCDLDLSTVGVTDSRRTGDRVGISVKTGGVDGSLV